MPIATNAMNTPTREFLYPNPRGGLATLLVGIGLVLGP